MLSLTSLMLSHRLSADARIELAQAMKNAFGMVETARMKQQGVDAALKGNNFNSSVILSLQFNQLQPSEDQELIRIASLNCTRKHICSQRSGPRNRLLWRRTRLRFGRYVHKFQLKLLESVDLFDLLLLFLMISAAKNFVSTGQKIIWFFK